MKINIYIIITTCMFSAGLSLAASPPPNIVAYIPITFTNYQGTAVAANTPMAIGTDSGGNIIGFNALAYRQYETCNLNNVEFFLANGMVLNSWMEGNMINSNTANALCTSDSSPNALADSANILYWVDAPNGFLPANTGTATTNTLYLGWAGNVLSPANNLLSNTITGENPILSSTYGQYDNGANVFSIYGAFQGSSMPAGWDAVAESGSYTPTFNGGTSPTGGIEMMNNVGSQGTALTYNSAFNTPNVIVEAGWMYDGSADNLGIGIYANSINHSNGGYNPYAIGGYYASYEFYSGSKPGFLSSGTTLGTASSQDMPTSGTNFVMSQVTLTSSNALMNFATNTGNIYESPAYGSSLTTAVSVTSAISNANTIFYIGSGDGGISSYMYLYWIRARLLPPNGILPATTFGSVIPVCTASIINPSNAIVDVGQYESFTATQSGCVTPFTYNILVVNSITPSVIAHNDLLTGQTANSVTYTFQTVSADTANSPEEANAVITDSGTNTVTSGYSSTFTINPALGIPTLSSSPSLPSTQGTGNTITFTATVSGGSSTYTYNYLITNTVTGSLVANMLFTGVLSTSNSFAWTIPSADVGNTVQANVIVTDSATTPETTNSVNSGTLTITAAPLTTPTLSNCPSSVKLDVGQTVSCTATETSGTFPFTYNWLISNSVTDVITANMLFSSVSSASNTFTYNVVSADTSNSPEKFNVIITDAQPSTGNSIYSSTFSIAPALTVEGIDPGNAIIDSGQSITLTASWSGGTPPYTVKWYTGPQGSSCQYDLANVIATYTSVTGTTNAISVAPTTTNSYCAGITDSATTNTVQFTSNYLIVGTISSGFAPQAGQVAFAPGGTYAYAVGYGYGSSSNAAIINTATNTVTGAVTGAIGGLTGVAFSPDGSYAYLANFGFENVLIVNTATNTVTGTINSGFNRPDYVSFSPSGTYAYVTNYDSNNVAIINTATNTVTTAITSGFNGPQGVAFSHSGTYAYVANGGSNNVVIINTATNTITGVITSGFSNPTAISFSPNGSYAYVTNTGSDNVVIINTATNTVTGAIIYSFQGPAGVAISPSGTYAYIANFGSVGSNTYMLILQIGIGNETIYSKYNQITTDPAMTAPTISPSNPTIDSGQSIVFNSAWSGGTPDYTAKLYSSSTSTCNTGSTLLQTLTSLTSGNAVFNSLSPTSNTYYCIFVTDNAYSPTTLNSINSRIVVNPTLSTPAINPSNPAIDEGDSVTFSSTWSGGTSTYGASLYSSATSTCNQESTLVQQQIGLNSGSATFSTVSPTSNTYYCMFITDNAIYSYSVSNVITSGIHLPQSVAVSPSGTYAYVANIGGSVVIINTATNTVTGSITSGFNNPRAISFSPDGSYAYVTNANSNNVVIINTATNTIASFMTSGFSDPAAVSFSPSGTYAYVANQGSNNVVIINTATNTVTNSITSEINQPSGVSFSPDGTYAYVANQGSNNVVIINTASNTVTGSINSGFSSSFGLSISPSGTYAYVVNQGSNNVVIINTATNTVTDAITSEINQPSGVSFSPDGTYAYVTNYNNAGGGNLTVISTGIPTTNSINSEIMVNPALSAGPITPSSPTIGSGQSITLTANPSGGTSPYTYNWYTTEGTTTPTCTTTNQISGQNINTLTVTPITTGTYAYEVIDSSLPSSIVCSAGDTVTIRAGTQVSNTHWGFGTGGVFATTTSTTTTSILTTYTTNPITIRIPNIHLIIPNGTTTPQLCNDTFVRYHVFYRSLHALFKIAPGIFGCFNITVVNTTAWYKIHVHPRGHSRGHPKIITSTSSTSTTRSTTSTKKSTSSISSTTSAQSTSSSTTAPTTTNSLTTIPKSTANSTSTTLTSSLTTTVSTTVLPGTSTSTSATSSISSTTSLLTTINQTNNVTNSSDLIIALNYSSSNKNVTSNVTLNYPAAYTNVVPFALQNDTWYPITTFKLNTSTNNITFAMPSTHIVALFSNTILNSTQTVNTTTILQTTASAPQITEPLSSQNIILLAAVLAVAIAVVLIYLWLRRRA